MPDPQTQRDYFVVGIDYGTTYSGLSYAISSNGEINAIERWKKWPGDGDAGEYTSLKCPSRMAYADKNPSFTGDKWGYEIPSDAKQCAWMKVHLDQSTAVTEYDHPGQREYVQHGMDANLKPEGKKPEDVTSDYFKGLYEYLTQTLEETSLLEVTDIKFWLTKPAIWSDKAETNALNAAKAAGFSSRGGDEINLILESEAAALAIISKDAGKLIQPGSSIIICDCGGGTVDLTAYIIEKIEPKLILKETCPAIGGLCGGTSVDQEFSQWMFHTYGDAFENLEKKAPGSDLMNSFERIKRTVGTGDETRVIKNLKMKEGDDPWEFYDEEFKELEFSGEQGLQILKGFFSPVVTHIKSLLQKQIDNVKISDQKNVEKVLLIGGFGDSVHLRKELEDYLKPQGIVLYPHQDSDWGAVSKGAVVRGLETGGVDTRRCRRYYGIMWSLPYDAALHSSIENESYIDLFGVKRVPNFMNWAVKKGDEITPTTRYEFGMMQQVYLSNRHVTCDVYSCDDDNAPERFNSGIVKKVGAIAVDLTSADFTGFEKKQVGNDEVVNLNCSIVINLGGKDGTIKFDFQVRGTSMGQTEIKFADDS